MIDFFFVILKWLFFFLVFMSRNVFRSGLFMVESFKVYNVI